jgi:PKHD-type hydroxylase
MAFLTTWYETHLPQEIVNILIEDIQKFDSHMQDSTLIENKIDKQKRNSKNVWIPTTHWIGGFLWHYIQRANAENFYYDITGIDGQCIQYTKYDEGSYYGWHVDQGLDTYHKPSLIPSQATNIKEDLNTIQGQYIRKLSFTLQLSDPESYTGGDIQFLDNNDNTYFAPKSQGSLIIFDSRIKHRVRTIKSGVRKSLVGWVMGPRFK